MNNQHLRTTILKLQDRLSDIDRQRLHFILANHVPRRIRDDQSLNGTLNLMESLFDQDKISEQNFSILIDAFHGIQFTEGLKILTELKKQVNSNSLNLPNPISKVSPLGVEEIIIDQEDDKSPSHSLLHPINNYAEHSKIIETNNTKNYPMKINVDTKQVMSSFSGEEQPFYISFKINRYFFFIIFFLLLAFTIVVIIVIVNINKKGCPTKEKLGLEKQKEFNERTQPLQNIVLEKEKEIAQLGRRVTELEEEKKNFLIKAGQKFGGTIGTTFDDSSSSDFTYSHYLNGLLARGDNEGLETYQFFYYSPYAQYQKIKSRFHGNEDFSQTHEFRFSGKNEKINKVEGVIANKTIDFKNGTNITIPIITGIKFTSTQDRDSPLLNDPSGITFEESFIGYTLGYVTGRANQYITQIQFFWYRT